MIATQKINSTNSKIIKYQNYESINVLNWNNNKWKSLCPYYLKTDGNEICDNPGNILFENFYQGTKVYDVVYENKVYPSRYHMELKYLWWHFLPVNNEGDIIVHNNEINHELYFRWRNSLWNCKNPIRYPNKINRRKNIQFSLIIDRNGNETRMDYLQTRKEIYVKEYIRLVKQTPEYVILLNKLKNGINIMICEVDVPAQNKKGNYSKNCDDNNMCVLSLSHLELLLNDTNEPFGHGLCLAYSLLLDLQ